MKFKFPGIKIIDRYIMRKFIGTYLFAIAIIIIIVVVFDMAEKIDDFIELKAPIWDIFAKYYLNFIPGLVNQLSGLFTFIAVIFFTSKMAYQTEIIAILSSGVSFKRLIWPYFLSATAIALLSLTLNLWIIPESNSRRIDFEQKYLKKAKRESLKFDENIYRQIEPGVFTYIRGYNGTVNSANYLVIEKYENNSIVQTLDAGNVKFNPETNRWTAPKYITRSFEGDTEIFEQHEKLDTMINLDAMELGRVEELIKTMKSGELNEFIRQQKDKGSDMIAIFEVERTQRMSYPVSTFILTLIGVALSSRKVRGGTGLHMAIGIGLCFSYILFAKFAEEFAKGGVLNPVLAVWLPNIIYSFIAIYIYIKAPK